MPHAANLTMVTVFSLHMMGAIANAGPHLEFSIEPEEHYPWQSPLFDPPLEVRDGKVQNPEAPGWGVAIRPDWLAGTEHRISALD